MSLFSDKFLNETDPENLQNIILEMRRDIEELKKATFEVEDVTNITESLEASGDVSGPASAVSGNLSSFSDESGKFIEDSGISAADVAAGLDKLADIPEGTSAGDVISDVSIAVVGQIATASDESGKHIDFSNYGIDAVALSGGVPLFLDDAASGIFGKQLVSILADAPTTKDTVLTDTTLTTVGEWTSEPVGTDGFPAGLWACGFSLSADSTFVPAQIWAYIYARTPAGVETEIEQFLWQADAPELSTTPVAIFRASPFDTTFPLQSYGSLDALDSILVRIKVQRLGGINRTVKVHLNDNQNPSFIKVPFWPVSNLVISSSEPDTLFPKLIWVDNS